MKFKSRSLLESESKSTQSNNKGTYVSMKVKNAQALYDHYTKQGVNCIPASEMHCTIAYSRKEFDHKITPGEVEIKYDEQIHSYLEPLGDEGCIVMKFDSKEMQERFQKCIDEGATYDYDSYIPHITITMDGKNLNLKDITRPDFNIILYNETVEELDLNWKSKLEDKTKKDIKKKNSKDYENSLEALNEADSYAKRMSDIDDNHNATMNNMNKHYSDQKAKLNEIKKKIDIALKNNDTKELEKLIKLQNEIIRNKFNNDSSSDKDSKQSQVDSAYDSVSNYTLSDNPESNIKNEISKNPTKAKLLIDKIKTILSKVLDKPAITSASAITLYLAAYHLGKSNGMELTSRINAISNLSKLVGAASEIDSSKGKIISMLAIVSIANAIMSGTSLVRMMLNNKKFILKFGSSENRIGSYKTLIQDATKNKDWFALDDLKNDKFIKNNEELNDMLNKALSKRPANLTSKSNRASEDKLVKDKLNAAKAEADKKAQVPDTFMNKIKNSGAETLNKILKSGKSIKMKMVGMNEAEVINVHEYILGVKYEFNVFIKKAKTEKELNVLVSRLRAVINQLRSEYKRQFPKNFDQINSALNTTSVDVVNDIRIKIRQLRK